MPPRQARSAPVTLLMETEATTATVASAGKGAGNRPLEGMVALVSGGSRGLGRLLSARLAVAGAAIALIARSPGELAAAVGEINQAGGVAAAVSADVTDRRATAAAVAELRERLGTVDILVNNAGISGPIGPAWQARPAEWWQAIEVNFGGAFVLTQLALAQMIPAGRGRLINITSYAGVYRWPLMSAYAASKAALVKLTETLAEETRPHGVSVFSVDPGLLPIGLGEVALRSKAGQQTPEGRVHGWIRDQFAAGRGADPEEAARLILALASGHADRLSGRHLGVTENLDALLARIDRIERDDSDTLRLRASGRPAGGHLGQAQLVDVNALRIDAEVRRIENRPVHHADVAAQLAAHVFRRAEHSPLLDPGIPRGDHAGHVAAGQGVAGRDALGGEL